MWEINTQKETCMRPLLAVDYLFIGIVFSLLFFCVRKELLPLLPEPAEPRLRSAPSGSRHRSWLFCQCWQSFPGYYHLPESSKQLLYMKQSAC